MRAPQDVGVQVLVCGIVFNDQGGRLENHRERVPSTAKLWGCACWRNKSSPAATTRAMLHVERHAAPRREPDRPSCESTPCVSGTFDALHEIRTPLERTFGSDVARNRYAFVQSCECRNTEPQETLNETARGDS
ncbi:MAG TPA: hypothetical protein VF846_06750 [Thermoanaerobaculia bacterium]|jgi:hypothetical protein